MHQEITFLYMLGHLTLSLLYIREHANSMSAWENGITPSFFQMSSQWIFGLFLDIPKYFWVECYYQKWLSEFGETLQSMLVWRWSVTLGWMVCQTMIHGLFWSGMWEKGGIGVKICTLDPFQWMDPLLSLKPLIGYEYPLLHHHSLLHHFNLAVGSNKMSQQRHHFQTPSVVQKCNKIFPLLPCRGGGVADHPNFIFWTSILQKMNNEAKTGLRGEQEGMR